MTRDAAVQADRGMSRREERFQQEYVQRATELREALADRCAEVRAFQDEIIPLREQVRALERELVATRDRARAHDQIVVAPARGERYHLPGCGNVRHSTTRLYTPCAACVGRGG